MLKGVEYRRIDDAGMHIMMDGRESCIAADTVIICAGQDPFRPISTAVRNLHLIGGAKEAGELDAKRAMLEGAELATML
jgi:2,4-dienoyl-CoA reductase (NADPH2)